MADRVRIHDVARAAGVSVTTVSHALSGRGKVSAATRDRVRRFATELGYAPNRVASALRLRRTGILGFVSDEVATTAFAGDIVLGAQEAAAARGMTLMLVNSDRDPGGGRRQVDALLAQQVDGLLWATMYHRAVEAPPVPDSTPLVLVNAVAPGSGLPAVVPDEEGLAVTATRLLIDAGHRSIAHVTIAEDRLGAAGRIAGYRSAMLAAGLRPHVVHGPAGPSTATTGRAAFARAMAERPDTTAVFCFNDPMAMGVYQGAADLGVRVPDDLSVVGVDDLEIIAAHLRPALTTLALPHAAMGRWAVDELVRRVEGEDPGPSTHPVRLACSLVTRASVAPPPS